MSLALEQSKTLSIDTNDVTIDLDGSQQSLVETSTIKTLESIPKASTPMMPAIVQSATMRFPQSSNANPATLVPPRAQLVKSSPKPPRNSLRERTVRVLQYWECMVINVNDGEVSCEMHDLTDLSNPVEYAEVEIDEFNVYDRSHVAPGAIFYWSVGMERSLAGTIRRTSEFRLQRVPKLSKRQQLIFSKKARELSDLFSESGRAATFDR